MCCCVVGYLLIVKYYLTIDRILSIKEVEGKANEKNSAVVTGLNPELVVALLVYITLWSHCPPSPIVCCGPTTIVLIIS